MVPDFLVEELRGGDDFDGVEGSERHVEAVEGAEIGEFLEGDGFGVEVGGLDLPTNLLHGFRDEEGFFH